MDNNVVWKPIPDYEGYYEVSSNGEIRSCKRYVNNRNGFRYRRVMRQFLGCSGYLQVGLRKNGKRENCKIHKIVASVFVPNPEGKPCIDHINTDRTDNRACNLRWVTLKENSNNPLTKIHSKYGKEKTIGKRRNLCQRFKNNAPNRPKPVHRYALDGAYIDSFQSLLEAELVTGIEINGIRKALDRSYKYAGGFLWATTKTDRCMPYKRRRHTKCISIQMFDENWVLQKEWDAVRDAAIELGTTHSRILRYMEKNIPMDGHYFKYK